MNSRENQLGRRAFCVLLAARILTAKNLATELKVPLVAATQILEAGYIVRTAQSESDSEQTDSDQTDRVLSSTPAEATPPADPPKPFGSIFGIHDTPGGSKFLKTMVLQLKPLKPKTITGISPLPDWYDAVQEIGADPIIRLDLPQNGDHPDEARKQINQVPQSRKIVARNEMNLNGETGGNPTFPWTAAEYDAKTIRLIADRGCIPLLTPTSPEGWLMDKNGTVLFDQNGNPLNEYNYYKAYIQRLEALGVFRDFPQIGIAFHAYDFQFHAPSAALMFDRLNKLYSEIVLPIAGEKDVDVTEGGIFLADIPIERINYKLVGDAITKLMGSDIGFKPANRLKSFGYWVYAADAQNYEFERPRLDSRFEKTALVQLVKKPDGQLYSAPNAMYQAIYQYQQTH